MAGTVSEFRNVIELSEGVVMGFITQDTEGILGGAAATAGLAGEHAGHGAQITGAGAVVPPGLEEISAMNQARIVEYAAQAAAMVENSAAYHAEYGAANGLTAGVTSFTDALNAVGISAVI
jgi:hypothetical protein